MYFSEIYLLLSLALIPHSLYEANPVKFLFRRHVPIRSSLPFHRGKSEGFARKRIPSLWQRILDRLRANCMHEKKDNENTFSYAKYYHTLFLKLIFRSLASF